MLLLLSFEGEYPGSKEMDKVLRHQIQSKHSLSLKDYLQKPINKFANTAVYLCINLLTPSPSPSHLQHKFN